MWRNSKAHRRAPSCAELIHRKDRVLASIAPRRGAALARIYGACRGARPACVGTSGVVGAYTGLADVGTATMTECVDDRRLDRATASRFPVIMDGDTGHGGIMAVRRMVRECIRARHRRGAHRRPADRRQAQDAERRASRSCRSSRRSPAIAPPST